MKSIAYFNGKWLPLEKVKISPLDRGFLFSDGVYEVIPVYNNKPFFLESHIERLLNSLKKISLTINLPIMEIVLELIRKNCLENQIIYVQITRGVAKRNHAFPKNVSPTVFMMSSLLERPSNDDILTGVSAITSEDNRWLGCDIKSISLLPNVLAREKAVKENCTESILIRDGRVTEGAASSIWIVRNKILQCPKPNRELLEGVRISILELICEKYGIKFLREDFSYSELLKADEVIMTSATKEILSVTVIDKKLIGTGDMAGKPGKTFFQLRQAYTNLLS